MAVVALASWNPTIDPEPSGWNRHPATNRYRIEGDPGREIRPDLPPPAGFKHPWNIHTGWTRI